MRTILAALSLTALLCAAALAQQPTPSTTQAAPPGAAAAQSPAAQEQAANHLKIAPGSIIPVQLAKTIDAKKAKTGDEVVATVTQDMKTNSGDVIVPKDTKVIGHVTEAQARNKEQKQSELGIAFDHAVIKGDQMQLPMSIQAVIAPPSPSSDAGSGAPEARPSVPSGSTSSPMGGGRGGATSTPARQNYPQSGASESEQGSGLPPINGNTQGVIGISDMKLESGSQNSQQGSVLMSEKNNVKIEKGTLMLLRVNQ